MMEDWLLPNHPADWQLLVAELDNVPMKDDEYPKLFSRVAQLETKLRAVGIAKSEQEDVQILVRRLPARYDVEKRPSLSKRDVTRAELQDVVRGRYATLKASEMRERGSAAATPAVSANPHALVVGRGFGHGGDGGSEGGGGQRRNANNGEGRGHLALWGRRCPTATAAVAGAAVPAAATAAAADATVVPTAAASDADATVAPKVAAADATATAVPTVADAAVPAATAAAAAAAAAVVTPGEPYFDVVDIFHGGGGVDGENGGGSGGGDAAGADPETLGNGEGTLGGGLFATHLVCSVTLPPPLREASDIFPYRPGSTVFLGDTGAVVHVVPSEEKVYNKRPPLPEERLLLIGDGKHIPVECFGDLDVIFHRPEDVRVTLKNVGGVPGLALDILSLNKIQDRHEIKLNRHGASILGGQPLAMVSAMLRPVSQSSMENNALLCSLGHDNAKTLYETATQMGTKVTGTPEYCDGCAESKAIQRSVPKIISPSRRTTRPLERVAMDLAGPFGQSSGGAKYVMQILDHHTNYGWICFLREKSSTNVVAAFRAWYASIKSLLATHGGLGCVLTDNGTEWVNAEFRGLLAELNITRELTAVDGPKSNGRQDHSSTMHKIITPAGVPTYSEHCTFGFSSQGFRGDWCSWGSVGGMAGVPAVAAGAASSAAVAPTATAATTGGSVVPAAAARGTGGVPAVAAGAAASATAPAATAESSGGSVPPAAAAGGTAETPAATEQRQNEHMTEPESIVESGAARSAVLAELARMAGGPSWVSTPAAPDATPAPAHSAAAPLASDGLWTEMVHEDGASGRRQGQREDVATPAMTRSLAKRDGPGPGISALLGTEDEIKLCTAELPAPGVAEPTLPTELARELETPETYGEAHAGPHHNI
ncbi:unnamed protein product [Ectocarpus sp. CCAP 1310/34]|nr:unnamed protein product [Ectocarpus sp. CCAP 1310/34]